MMSNLRKLKLCIFLSVLVFAFFKVGTIRLYANGAFGPKVQNTHKSPFWLFKHTGLEVSLGAKMAFLHSERIPELNSELIKGGGTLGVYFGNDYLKFPVRVLGFYTEAIKDDYNTDFFEASIEANINILKILGIHTGRVQTYALTGLGYSSTSFSGTYVSPEHREVRSRGSMDPFIGKINQRYISTGWGMEYQVFSGLDYFSLFVEGKSLMGLSNDTDYEILRNTALVRNFNINVGLRVGKNRR